MVSQVKVRCVPNTPNLTVIPSAFALVAIKVELSITVNDADYPDGEGDVEDQCFSTRKQWITSQGSDPYGRQPP